MLRYALPVAVVGTPLVCVASIVFCNFFPGVCGEHWRSPADRERDRDVPADVLAKLSASAGIAGRLFYGDVYNGSEWYVRDATVQITVRYPGGAVALSRQYRVAVNAAPFRSEHTTSDLGFELGTGQTWGWNIVSARGLPNGR